MTSLCSRGFQAFAAAIAVLGAANAQAQAQAPAGYYKDQKVVYHDDGSAVGGPEANAAYFKKFLKNVHNHIDAVGKEHVEIRVVNHGDGVGLLQDAAKDPALAGQLDELKKLGVRFLVCRNTLSERHLDWHTLYGVAEADLVPSGAAELARLQGLGFAYIHP